MEAGLVVGLILAYLNQVGRMDLNRYVYFGLALAALASLSGAVGFSASHDQSQFSFLGLAGKRSGAVRNSSRQPRAQK